MAEMYSSPYQQAVAEGALPPGHFDVHVQTSRRGSLSRNSMRPRNRLSNQQLGLTASHEQQKMSVYLLQAPNGKTDALRPTTGG